MMLLRSITLPEKKEITCPKTNPNAPDLNNPTPICVIDNPEDFEIKENETPLKFLYRTLYKFNAL